MLGLLTVSQLGPIISVEPKMVQLCGTFEHTAYYLSYLGSEQQKRWSDWAEAQADLRCCCSHMA